MAIATEITPHELGRIFAEAVGADERAAGLWASADLDGLHLWLVVEPMELDAERHFHELADVLYERFPDLIFEVHILNPRNYAEGAETAVPEMAEKIFTRAV